MTMMRRSPYPWGRWALAGALLLALRGTAVADTTTPEATDPAKVTVKVEGEEPPRVDVYGFAMLDMGYETGQSDPNWFDVMRPTKLPAFDNEFGEDHHYYASVRQSRLGFKGFFPTDAGEVKTIFEFELFGTGVDAGQTTFRLRHAWGELGRFGAGQTWSPFMDIDVFPNSIEYWGPNGMVFFRNVQFRFTPWKSDHAQIVVAAERPGASADQGPYADHIALEHAVTGRFPAPDISAHYRQSGDWGHFQVSGIVRWIKWDDVSGNPVNLTGSATGWGIHGSTNLKFGKDVLRASIVYGEAIENYMNDAPVDIAPVTGFTDSPFKGKPVPVLGVVGFIDMNWNETWTSTAGFSYVHIDNTNGQEDTAFRNGYYALVNALYHPTSRVFMGPEVQWGKRENFRDSFTPTDVRIQFSAKYSFDASILGGKK